VEGRDAEVVAANFIKDGLQIRDDAGHDRLVDILRAQVLVLKEGEGEDAVLVGELLDIGGKAPGGAEILTVVDTEGGDGVADVEGE
jgi:hypothetical protein